MDFAVEEGSRGQEHVPRGKFHALAREHASGAFIVRPHAGHLILPDEQVRQGEERLLDGAHVGLAVHLAAGGAHGRALAHIEDAELDACRVGPQAHVAS